MKYLRKKYSTLLFLPLIFAALFSCTQKNPSVTLNYKTEGLTLDLQVSAFNDDSTISKIIIDWGDGTDEQLVDGNLNEIEKNHLYTSPATYTVFVTANDVDGRSTSKSIIVPVEFKEVVLDNIKESMFKISEDEFLLLTINLHTYQENNQIEKFDILTQVIGKMDIDFIAFQECAQNKSAKVTEGIIRKDNMALIIKDSLKQKFGKEYNFAWDWAHYGWNVWEEGIAVMSKYPMLSTDSKYISSSTSKTSITSRKTIVGSYQIPQGIFNLFSAHTHWRTSEADTEQNKQIKNIQQLVDEQESINIPLATFVCGDFNGNPTSSYPWSEGYFTMINHNEYIDSFLEIYPDANSKPTKSSYNTVSGTFPGRIDYIFMKNNPHFKIVDSQIIFTNNDVGTISDHFGVITKISYVK